MGELQDDQSKTILVRNSKGQFYHITPEQRDEIMARDLGYCYVLTGARGSGKTLFMSYLGIEAMAKGHNVWSNYKIHWELPKLGGGFRHLESQPLDMNALFRFDKDLNQGYVLVDEINLWCSARRSMAVANRLLNSVLQLMRKRRLTFIFTTQNFKWLDNQLRFQTDVHIMCRDQYFLHPGELRKGERITLVFQDMSGVKTGQSALEWGETPRNTRTCTFYGQRFWGSYNTWEEFDVVEAGRRIRMLNDVNVLDFREGKELDDPMDSMSFKGKVGHLLEVVTLGGHKQMSSQEMQDYFADCGLKMDSRKLGKALREQGWRYKQTRKGNFYVAPDIS